MSQADLARRIGAVLPSGVEAVTGARLTAEQQAEVEGDLVDALELGLAAFAFVAWWSPPSASSTRSRSWRPGCGVGPAAGYRCLPAPGADRRGGRGGPGRRPGSVLGVAAGVVLASGLLAATAAVGFPLPTDGLVVAPGDAALAVAMAWP